MPATPPPLPPSSSLSVSRSSPALLLALLGHVAMRRLRDAHTAHGLTPRQFHLMGLLHENGPIGQRELGVMMGTDPSILVTMLNPLEAERLVARDRDAHDRRRHLVTLTPDGEAKLVAAAHAQREVEHELFAGLDDEQREQLLGLLTTLHDGLAGAEATPCCPGPPSDTGQPSAAGRLSPSHDRSST